MYRLQLLGSGGTRAGREAHVRVRGTRDMHIDAGKARKRKWRASINMHTKCFELVREGEKK